MRSKIVLIVLIFIIIPLIFFWWFFTRSYNENIVAIVNKDDITLKEYALVYWSMASLDNANKEDFKENVLDMLINRKIVAQEAEKVGLLVTEEEIQDKIFSVPYFQSEEGGFDLVTIEQREHLWGDLTIGAVIKGERDAAGRLGEAGHIGTGQRAAWQQ